MAKPVLHRVCHGTSKPELWQIEHLTIRPAVLHNFRRHRVVGRDYPGIVPVDSSIGNSNLDPKGSRSSVRGTVVSGLTDADIWRLDIFEGDEYEQRAVKVRVLEHEGQGGSGTGSDGIGSDILDAKETEEEIDAVTYVWLADRDVLEDEEWDFESFLKDKMHLWAA